MRQPVTLITGANGEIGHGLIDHFSRHSDQGLIALDLKPLDPSLEKCCTAAITGDILDDNLLKRLISEYEIHAIYHLAALLSTRGEYTPETAHRVNVNGTLNLLHLAAEQARWHGSPVKFLFPSSIAVYGMPDAATKASAAPVREDQFNAPTTMYGCNKLYCEQVGRYYTHHYRQLAADRAPAGVDFRALRFPCLISAVTVPSGGTSDFAPEMIHAAAKNQPYTCYVSAETRIPFMAMPDAIAALIDLAAAPADRLTQRVYNVTAFSATAAQIRDRVLAAYPQAKITFDPDPPRAKIADSWPAEVDDTPAKTDWNWCPKFNMQRTFQDYLIPNITPPF